MNNILQQGPFFYESGVSVKKTLREVLREREVVKRLFRAGCVVCFNQFTITIAEVVQPNLQF